MQATIIRKASSKTDWYERVESTRALLGREPKKREVVIEKEIILTDTEFTAFERNLLEDNEIVKQYKLLMYADENEVLHCIAITSKNAKYKILVESEGYNYARYTAIVQK